MAKEKKTAAEIAEQALAQAKANEQAAAEKMRAAGADVEVDDSSESEAPVAEETKTEDTASVSHQDPEIKCLNPTIRERKIVSASLESSESKLFVKEWGVKEGFDMIQRVRRIFAQLREAGVFTPGEDVDSLLRADSLMEVLGAVAEDVLVMASASAYHDQNCTTRVERDYVDEMSMGDLVIVLRSIWAANFTHGALKNALAGLVAATAS